MKLLTYLVLVSLLITGAWETLAAHGITAWTLAKYALPPVVIVALLTWFTFWSVT